jgi:peptidoglycan/LPS O-acetylase OafA/YrhL
VDQGRKDSSRLPALDLLRLAAVGAVILYHYGFWGPASHGVPQVALPALAPVAQYGFLGVPVFFAISGFVIAYSAEGRTATGFAIARFSRIYPTFVLCMTLTSGATLLFGAGHFEATPAQWFANLFVAAPLIGQPYVDTSYWSLVIEIVFYAWVAAFIALGIFPRRIDTIIVAWLAITFANELTIDAPIFEKLFMADDSGFFAVGLLMYQHYRGRRGAKLWALSALALGTAVFQAIHKLERLDVHTHGSFDPRVVAAICIVSLVIVFFATRIKSVPVPANIILAAGGITYPLYLLHMQFGYVIFMTVAPGRNVEAMVSAIVFGAVLISFVVWRFAEIPAHRWLKARMTEIADLTGLSSPAGAAPSKTPAI